MNRRDFLKRIAAAGLVAAAPEVLVPERRFWQLDRTMAAPEQRINVPPTRNGSDSAWLQWRIDNDLPIPPDYYTHDTPLVARPGQYINFHDSIVEMKCAGLFGEIDKDARVAIMNNVIKAEGIPDFAIYRADVEDAPDLFGNYISTAQTGMAYHLRA